MDVDPRSEGLPGQDPMPPPRVPPVSPRPRDKVCPGVPKRCSVPQTCPVPPSGAPGGIPPLEELLRQVRSLQKVDQATAQELAKAREHSEGLRQHLEHLEQRKEALEGRWQRVQEALQRARLQGKEVEAKGQRHSELCLEQQQDLERTEQRREQLRHLRREHRLQYCQQLDAMMEELKHLRVTHTPAHLKAELMKLQEVEEKWLSLERRAMEVEEHLGPEAPAVWRLVHEEQERAEQQLEAELGRQQQSLQRRDRLAEELQQLQRALEAQPVTGDERDTPLGTPVTPE